MRCSISSDTLNRVQPGTVAAKFTSRHLGWNGGCTSLSQRLNRYWTNRSTRRYLSLFFGQLYLEKLLKAHYAKSNTKAPHAPKKHNLLLLAHDDKEDRLEIITRFNLEARTRTRKKNFTPNAQKNIQPSKLST